LLGGDGLLSANVADKLLSILC